MRCPQARALLLLIPLAFFTGCGQPPPPGSDILAGFEPGTPRSEVMNALPEGPALEEEERLSHGYFRNRYLIGGSNVVVLWVRGPGEEALAELDRPQVNPVIFRDDLLDGWGWEHFDRRAADWDLLDMVNPPRAPATEFQPERGLDPDREGDPEWEPGGDGGDPGDGDDEREGAG